MAGKSSKAPTDSLTVPWSDTVRFVRQLSHDLRNDLNAIELRSAYVGELTQDQELTSEIKRLREVVSDMNSTLQLLSRAVGEVTPNVITYPAGEFLADMRTQIERKFSKENHEITWDLELQDGYSILIRSCSRKVFVELLATLSGTIAARAHWLQGPESAMGGSCSRSMNQKRFSFRKRKIGGGNRSATSDRDIMVCV
jgi:hypothetical protein